MTVNEATDRWVREFRRTANQDPELQEHGSYYTCSFLLDTGEHRYLVNVNRGKVEEIVTDPDPSEERHQFAVRASADIWQRFGQEIPEPKYHGIFAASFQKDMRLEGDLLVLMQNLRCFVRHLELMRKTGAPA